MRLKAYMGCSPQSHGRAHQNRPSKPRAQHRALWPSSALGGASNAPPPDQAGAGEDQQRYQAGGHRENRSRRGQGAARRPGDGGKRFGESGEARGDLPTAEMAACGLGAEPQLDRRGRSGGDDDADRQDQRDERREQRRRAMEGAKTMATPPRSSRARHRADWRGGDEIGRILAREGESGEAASKLSRGPDQDRNQQRQPN